ncbi:tRNA lysidine(34) synthetase TilS [Ruania suaedae]|uniref:tRNA lysidine(34) synthetase TilS n=1 Tax=Ruania suaedae TaxID=2897774 RepID=UPI001E5FC5E9|nr:tRNA lysidine(34) synthetase TilS [Ruania suaedae]UFU03502.1 tRNA lysidine(34) synthetase TilS [Ruania suaedae]
MPGPAAPVARLRHTTRTFLEERLEAGEVSRGELLLVACSGGPDSLALAAAAAFVAPRLGLRAGAVVVDHGLQPGSEAVAQAAGDTCAGLGLAPVEVVRATVTGKGEGPEAGARAARYDALTEASRRHGARAVLLGHTADDQAETVLLALARGSGTRSLAAMAAVRAGFWRPFLTASRADTRDACHALGLVVWDDPTNAVDGPWRTADGRALPRAAVRHRVLPALEEALGPGARAGLVRTARLARDDADLLDQLAEAEYTRIVQDGSEQIALDVGAVVALPPALRLRVLRLAALRAGAAAGGLGHVHVEAMDALVSDWSGQGPTHLPGGVSATRTCGRLVLSAGASGPPGPY